MTSDDIIRMARAAGLLVIGTADGGEAVYTWPKGITEELERFAELVRADERERAQRENAYVALEREACAKVCDARAAEYDGFSAEQNASEKLAAAIRARGQA